MMFKNLPELIKINYITSISLTVISLILGIFLKKPELYLGFFTGSLISMINTYLTIIGAYKAVDEGNHDKFRGMFEFLKKIIIYCAGMYFVRFISQKYFDSYTTRNIIATAVGFLNFKVSLFINNIILKFAKS